MEKKKLTKSQRLDRNDEIRNLYATDRYSMQELGDRYSLSVTAIFFIVKGRKVAA